MIKSLEIKGYRGFKDFKVSHTADVNLFVGRNNVGKTSILEAAQLFQSNSPIATLSSIANRRREVSSRTYESAGRILPDLADISHTFYGHSVREGQQIRLQEVKGTDLTFRVLPHDDEQPSFRELEPSIGLQTFQLHALKSGQLIERGELTDGGVLLEDHRVRRTRPLRLRGERNVFISPDSISPTALVSLYNEVIVRAAENRLVGALKLLDSNVTGVYFLASDRTFGIDGGAGILIGRNGTERNPIGSFGDGMRRLLALAMAFVNTSEGLLLVDEIDTGLHYSVMQDLWKLVLGSTAELQSQAFVTTHSLDCVRGLYLALQENPESAMRVAVHKINGRLEHAVTFTGDELRTALSNDLELR